MNKHEDEDVAKYETNDNAARWLLDRFFDCLNDLISSIPVESIYEAGCGNGYVTEYLKNKYPSAHIVAMDVDEDKIAIAKTRVEGVDFSVGNIYHIPQERDSFDLVISTEVLEHLETPLDALNELARISKKYILISVPNEPLFRLAHIARFKHIRSLGNCPGHINHWNKKTLYQLAQKICDVREVRTPLPFVVLLCEKRNKII